MPTYSMTDPPVLAFFMIPIVLVLLLAAGAHHAARRGGASRGAARTRAIVALLAAAGWMALTWAAASSGWLAQWDRRPPPIAALIAGVFAGAGLISLTRFGGALARHVPLWGLVAVQAFRLPLELAMHAMVERGIMPPQMSYAGWNFDILTGISAAIVAVLVRLGYGGRRLVAAWNVLGATLLAVILVIAVASLPTFALFGPERLNVWVAYPPFVWLPAVMVLAALAGHVLVWRALRIDAR